MSTHSQAQSGQRVGSILGRSLLAHGVDRVFCVPGESYLGFTDALSDLDGIDLVVCRHEGSAGFMAMADGQLCNRPGVYVVSRGPGMANGMIALHSALHDTRPLVVLVGHVERSDVGRMALQEQNYPRLLADVTKAVIEVNLPDQASEAVARAFRLAQSGTPGPVAIILPEDIFDLTTERPINRPRPAPLMAPGGAEVKALAERLVQAARPLVWVGGALSSDRTTLDELARLAERWGLPVAPTQRRPQLFATDHPNYAGYMGIRPPAELTAEMKRSDLLVALGERLTDTVSQSYSFPSAPEPQLPLVHVWPDPEELGRVWRADLPIPCDPAEMIRALLALPAPTVTAERRAWIKTLNDIGQKIVLPVWEPASDGVNFAAVVCGVNRHLAPDAIVTSDAGNFASFLQRYMHFRPGQEFLSSVVGAMGSGVPMAVAASMRHPRRQVVGFVGDGGMLMNGNELATAVQYGATPIIVLSDNCGYGTIALHHQTRYPGRPLDKATGLRNPDFVAWAKSFGAVAIPIRDESDVAEALAEAFAEHERPTVVCVTTSGQQMSAWRRRAT